ncbi:MAG: Bax inhibitor-1/YccA family protein [Treponema sp.]|nr:Bax inhibitor-1/YccA family protein [Treponema sp.]
MNTLQNYRATASEKGRFLTKTYAWMAFALVLSAAAAWYTSNSIEMISFIWGGKHIAFYVLAFVEIALVWGLSASIRRISRTLAAFLFILYALINGVTLASVFILFSTTSIAYCFLGAAGMFLLMSIYGMTTKQSLAKAGHYLMMALLGVILISVVNLIITKITGEKLSTLDWIISLATVVIFTGLTAYDSQKILAAAERADDGEAYQKLAIIGALELYLDFINIFLALLRLFGKSRD